jgi:hypothetical protein
LTLPKAKPQEETTTVIVRRPFEGGQQIITRRVHESAGDMPKTPVVYKIGGRQYPYKTVANCKVCQLRPEYRREIEEHVLNGLGWKTIARSLPADLNISDRNISDHVHNEHMPLEQSIKRVLVEDAYQRLGSSVEDAENTLITWLGFARLGLQEAFERLRSGKMSIDAKDGIAFAEMLMRADQFMAGQTDYEAWVKVFDVFWDEIDANAPPEVAQAIGRAIATNPVLNSLEERRQQAIEAASEPVPAT